MKFGQLRFALPDVALQHEIHGIDDEQAILHEPEPGADAEQVVFERPTLEVGQTGVDAGGVAAQQVGLLAGQQLEGALGPLPELVDADFAVAVQGTGADEFAQFTGRRPPGQVHLEIALLGVDESQSVDEIVGTLRPNGDDAGRIPFHGDGGHQASHGRLAGQPRHGRLQQPADVPVAAARTKPQHGEEDHQGPEDAAAGGWREKWHGGFLAGAADANGRSASWLLR